MGIHLGLSASICNMTIDREPGPSGQLCEGEISLQPNHDPKLKNHGALRKSDGLTWDERAALNEARREDSGE